MKFPKIETESEHALALAQLDALMDSKPRSEGEHELDRISLLIEEYEAKHHQIAPVLSH